MSKQDIIDRILADAQAGAESIIEQVNKKAGSILASAEAYSKKETEEAQRECNEYAKDVMEKRAAAARLEGGKIVLAEKRRTLDYIYSVALARLKELANEDPLTLYSVLIERYADWGDTVCLPVGFAYPKAVESLPAFEAKNLKLSPERVNIDGGMLLIGEKADKDVSFSALIEQDKDVHLAGIAAEIFKK